MSFSISLYAAISNRGNLAISFLKSFLMNWLSNVISQLTILKSAMQRLLLSF